MPRFVQNHYNSQSHLIPFGYGLAAVIASSIQTVVGLASVVSGIIFVVQDFYNFFSRIGTNIWAGIIVSSFLI